MSLIRKIPILTTIFSAYFFVLVWRHWRSKPDALYLFWWALGILFYGAGTAVESIVGLFGWNEPAFRLWYIFGALFGGAPLAQGTVYLLLKRKTAHILTAILVAVVLFASTAVWLSPIDYSLVEPERLTGKVLMWRWVRLMTPFINMYAFVFLVGGAVYSAVKYSRIKGGGPRVWGNILIAVGALLPGIGGAFTKAGYTEVLYVTEFVGLLLIYAGYQAMKRDHSSSAHEAQQSG